MTLRRSTRIWIVVFVVAILGIVVDGPSNRFGGWVYLFVIAAWQAGAILVWRAGAAFFRAVMHRLALRLAFSYFLIGIVPIPLLAALAIATGFLLSHLYIATRLRGEVDTMAELARASDAGVPTIRLDHNGRVASSEVPWLSAGDEAPWAAALTDPHPLVGADEVFIGIRTDRPAGAVIRLIPIQDRKGPWLHRLADRTGYSVAVELGSSESNPTGYQVRVRRDAGRAIEGKGLQSLLVPPGNAPPSDGSLWRRQMLAGVYLDRAVAVIGETKETAPVVAFIGRTSPAVLAAQLNAQGVPEVQRVVRIVLALLVAALLCVYLVALAIAFGLVASIVRNVNRLTRAARSIGRGDFSVRVATRSKDQIGELAHSFDGMAESIERLLKETARKEKLEADLAVARAIQDSFLPEAGVSWKGFQAAAHFEPIADLGGDYYDILPMPDGRTAVVLGDVSGHGLPTALVAAAARSTIATLIEAGVSAPDAFARLARRRERSRSDERRLYTTLAIFAYDASTRAGTLTNAGHPAPYRVSGGRVERIELPALPIGLLPGREIAYPSKTVSFAPGDRLVFFTDGVVEASNADEEPWGYERLETLLARDGRRPADELVREILDSVATHVGATPLDDDRTLLILSFDAV
ncbi:MAG TPA: SpoIIE family protein phosphatase [Thermoanaerobaculia bacterium]|nr:SpoIIE family protein phosphatase [Thermoanaerobaculia bacterium]